MEFYAVNLCVVFFFILNHICFRTSIYSYIRHSKRRSDTFIKKHSKGLVNYWFYEELNRELSLGLWYRLNKINFYAVIFVSFTIIAFGYMEFMQIPITVLTALMASIQVPIGFLDITTSNIEDFGKPFVFLGIRDYGRDYNGRYRISFILTDLLFPFVHFIFVWLNVKFITGC